MPEAHTYKCVLRSNHGNVEHSICADEVTCGHGQGDVTIIPEVHTCKCVPWWNDGNVHIAQGYIWTGNSLHLQIDHLLAYTHTRWHICTDSQYLSLSYTLRGRGHVLQIVIVREGIFWNTRQLVVVQIKAPADTDHEVSQSRLIHIHTDVYRGQIMEICIDHTFISMDRWFSSLTYWSSPWIHIYALIYTHRPSIPLATIQVAEGGDTYSKLELFLKTCTGILVSWLLCRKRLLWTRVTRCHNHAWSACTQMWNVTKSVNENMEHIWSCGQVIHSTYRLIIYMHTHIRVEITHTLSISLGTIHVAGGRHTHCKLGLFLNASTGILVSLLKELVSAVILHIQFTRCHKVSQSYLKCIHTDVYCKCSIFIPISAGCVHVHTMRILFISIVGRGFT